MTIGDPPSTRADGGAPAGPATAPGPEPGGTSLPPWRRALSALGLLVLVAAALFGADVGGVRSHFLSAESQTPRKPVTGRAVGTGAPSPGAGETLLVSQPWWQQVSVLHGAGPATTASFSIDRSALQWRVSWSCAQGRLAVRVAGASQSSSAGGSIVDAGCPGHGVGYATQTGTTSLAVSAAGTWQLEVDQQIDAPLVEPPLPAMMAPGAARIATATLHDVDQHGTGTAKFYRLADGSYALRLESFYVTPNSDLEVRLSTLPDIHSTDQYLGATSVHVAPLDVTTGSLNVRLPAGVDPGRFGSVAIWCNRLRSLYAAAPLASRP